MIRSFSVKNSSKFLSFAGKLTLIASVGCLSSCAYNQNLALNKTGAGSLTGAALGAGTGAIIGSATGDAGEGLLMGSIAGAAIGGTIGAQLDHADEQYALRKEQIQKQQLEIEQSRRDIQQLRGGDIRLNNNGYNSGQDGNVGTYNYGTDRSRLNSNGISEGSVGKAYSGNYKRLTSNGNPTGNSAGNSAGNSGRVYIKEGSKFTGNVASKPYAASKYSGSTITGSPTSEYNEYKRKYGGDVVIPKKAVKKPVSKPRVYAQKPKTIQSSNTVVSNTSGLTTTHSSAPKKAPILVPLNQATSGSIYAELPKARNAQVEQAVKVETNTLLDNGSIDLPPAVVLDPTVSGKAQEIPQKLSSLKTGAGNCKGAKKEAARAESAASQADRLFYLRRAIKQCADEPIFHVQIGKVYSKLGRTNDAEKSFHKALDLDPTNQEAQDELTMMMVGPTF